jgi:hypothetical protein
MINSVWAIPEQPLPSAWGEKDVRYAFYFTGEIQKKAQGFCS